MGRETGSTTYAGAERFIALLDILGFTNLVEAAPLAHVAQKLEDTHRMVDEVARESNLLRGRLTSDDEASVDRLFFSDLVLLYTSSDSHRDLIDIIRVTAGVVHRAFHAGLLLRGSVTWGRCVIDPPVIVGRAINEAAALEKQQEWAGVCLASSIDDWLRLKPEDPARASVIEGMTSARWLTPWHIPLKTADGPQIRRALNWVVDAITPDKHYLGDMAMLPPQDVAMKRTNTRKFLQQML